MCGWCFNSWLFIWIFPSNNTLHKFLSHTHSSSKCLIFFSHICMRACVRTFASCFAGIVFFFLFFFSRQQIYICWITLYLNVTIPLRIYCALLTLLYSRYFCSDAGELMAFLYYLCCSPRFWQYFFHANIIPSFCSGLVWANDKGERKKNSHQYWSM